MIKHDTYDHLTFSLKIFSLLVVAALSMMVVVKRHAIMGGFDKRMTAKDRGDYVATLLEWHPLPKQGHAGAQYNLELMHNEGRGVRMDRCSECDLMKQQPQVVKMHSTTQTSRTNTRPRNKSLKFSGSPANA